MVRTLMKMGMSCEIPDASGRTALDIATLHAKGSASDPLVVYMTRTARVQAMQLQQSRSRRSRGAASDVCEVPTTSVTI
jgi:hypothetical protein